MSNLILETMGFKTKLTSLRLDEDVLAKIDAFCEPRKFYSRNYVINQLLIKLLAGKNEHDIWKMISGQVDIKIE